MSAGIESVLTWLERMAATVAEHIPSPPENWYWGISGNIVAGLMVASVLGAAGLFGPAVKAIVRVPFRVFAVPWHLAAARWERRQQRMGLEEERRASDLRSWRDLGSNMNEIMREAALSQNNEESPPHVVHSADDLPA